MICPFSRGDDGVSAFLRDHAAAALSPFLEPFLYFFFLFDKLQCIMPGPDGVFESMAIEAATF